MSFIRRVLVILGWVGLIFFFLYLPSWKILGESKTLNIFSWGDILEPSIISEFEKQTGIKVRLNFYASNEELLVKLKATKGKGYDLIIPSDYAVKLLAEEEMLKEIDKSALKFWHHLNPLLLGHSYDPENRFSIPFEWEIFGLGIDNTYFKHVDPSWDLIFDPKIINYKIAMLNDPIEALALSAFYLYGATDSLNPAQVDGVKQLLITQKTWVEAYANFRGDYFLATKNCPVVVASSSYIRRTMRQFPFVSFIIPKEGTFISIENLCIPKASKKEALTYRFINFLFRPTSVATHYTTFGFFPSTLQALDELETDPTIKKLIISSPNEFSKYHFIHTLIPEQEIHDLWIEIKTKD